MGKKLKYYSGTIITFNRSVGKCKEKSHWEVVNASPLGYKLKSTGSDKEVEITPEMMDELEGSSDGINVSRGVLPK